MVTYIVLKYIRARFSNYENIAHCDSLNSSYKIKKRSRWARLLLMLLFSFQGSFSIYQQVNRAVQIPQRGQQSNLLILHCQSFCSCFFVFNQEFDSCGTLWYRVQSRCFKTAANYLITLRESSRKRIFFAVFINYQLN